MSGGPEAYENWRRAQVERAQAEYTFPLYSDSRIEDFRGVSVGPFVFHGSDATRAVGVAQVRGFLSYTWHADDSLSHGLNLYVTDDSRYHGGTYADELAAVVGLAHGVRLRPSSEVSFRNVRAGHNSVPRAEEPSSVPLFSSGREPVMVNVPTDVALSTTALLQYVALPAERASVLAKAAMLFQEALWHSESNGNYSWLMLVSVVEATNKFVTGWCHPRKATKRFIEFLAKFSDATRPWPAPSVGALDWGAASLADAYGCIYDRRSRALHDGTPFPFPMCRGPSPDGETYREREASVAVGGRGGSWQREAMPMYLHVFCRLVQTAILNWWNCELQAVSATVPPVVRESTVALRPYRL